MNAVLEGKAQFFEKRAGAAGVVVDWDFSVQRVRLQVLVDVDRYPRRAGKLAQAWFGEGWRQLGGGMRRHLLAYPQGAPQGASPDFPFGIEARGTVHFQFSEVDDGDYWQFVYGSAEWERMLSELSALPAGAFFKCAEQAGWGGGGKFELDGSPAFYMTPNYLTMFLEKELTPDRQVMALRVDAREETLYGTVEQENRTVEFVRSIVDNFDVDYGDMTFVCSGRGTMVENQLGLGPSDTWFRARRVLRGYSWVTVVPDEIAERLGGGEAFAASGAFWKVERLRQGGWWLQATHRFVDYQQAEAERVFNVLAPVLPEGAVASAFRHQPDVSAP